MSSRRTTPRSTSWNGGSSNGDDSGGTSRPGGCSYLSNVRPENRSTLCSVMAQLTEETQPAFQTTLKSKAVSENCNVKFSCVVTGYPAPQVNWYKDDMQLDRYCGLPKYEIFRNGQNHSLHIYNCTVEDAAIYQASAINSKGIVSCSGVLEVGEMNEFKIHQRYFAKLKQKAEHRRREAEGKENQEPLRTISPDRTQRKRRSTMEAFLSMPSSMEDESNEESPQAVAVGTEDRLQEATVEEVEEKPVTNGQVINENGNSGGTYIYDSAQKIFTAHQPKTPFVKKKIKISNIAKVAKADTLGERVSEERRAKDETSASVALACIDPVQSEGNSEEVMEVEKLVSSTVDSDSRNVTEQCKKSTTEEAMLVERPSKDENVCVTPSQSTVSPAALIYTSHTVSGTGGKQAAKSEKEVGHKDREENFEMQKQSPYLNITSTQVQSSVASTPIILKEDIIKTEEATAMDTDEKSDTSTGGSLAHRDLKSVDTACESRTALPQHPCGRARDQLSDKETSPCQENVSEPRPAPLREVTQAHTKMNRNDAPVNLELPRAQRTMDAQPPQKTPSESKATTDDIQTPSLHCGLQAAIDKMTQDTWDHSRGSNESPMVLFTDLQKSPFESPGAGENTPGCNVSPTTPQSQVDTAIKTVEGTEIQADEEVEGNKLGKLLAEPPNEKIVEMETDTAALHMVEQTKTTKTRDVVGKDSAVVTVETSCKEKNEPMSKVASSSELQNLKSDEFPTAMPHLTNNPENTNTSEQIISFNEIQKPVSKVISIAELLRSQIKALDLTLANSMSTIPVQTDFVQEPTTTASKTSQELRDGDRKCKLEVKTSIPGRKTEAIIDDTPATNINVTLTTVRHQLSKTEQTQSATSPPAQALQKPLLIETTGPHGGASKYNKGGMDIGQENGTSSQVPSHCPVVSLTESENVKHKFLPSSSKDEVTNRPASISNLSGTVSQGSGTLIKADGEESNITILEHAQDEPVRGKDMESTQKLTPEIKLNSRTERGITEINSTTRLDRYKMEELNTNSSLQSVQKFPTQSVFSTDTQDSTQDSSMVEEFSSRDSLTNPTLEASPLLKKRNCVSPIPSATPQELASGARRKILTPKAKPKEATEATSPVDNQAQKKEVSTQSSKLSTSPLTPSVSPSLSRRSHLLQPAGEQTSAVERRSPLLSRRKTALETQAPSQQPTDEISSLKTEGKPTEKDKHNPFKAPQVIRKIRGETFADTSGHLKLWCQFFNVLSDSTIKWYKNEEEIAQIKRNAGDETQVNLAIVQASCSDSGVYGCSITNEYGTDSTDTLLSTDILAGMSLREDLGVGEEIEMTPLIFSKGVADSGIWANKLFGRIMMQESHIGDGCSHKVWRAKVIYGLEPVFESGNTCIIKVRNPIAYGGKEESCLVERNLDIVKQECKIQNLAREYCKIFSAEARVIENFGPSLEVLPVYLMYRPANTVPYATVEADLTGVYQKYSVLDHTGRIDVRTGSVVEQKCCALQHWIFQWTNGNLLLTRLEGVDTKITNVGISVKSTGHQGLCVEGNPKVFEQFVSQHQCNYFCGLLGLRSLKVMDSLLTPTKPKGSRSPLLQRKIAAGSSSPQTGRKAAGSPRMPRKAEPEGRMTPTKQKAADAPKVVKMA
ncbi:alpha-protein kinase 3 isoform X1 [Seriola aureovittata]|uniref:alpha-protein kinase 3 isoform X1 n=1 Tax=Seriola aureovittata TaxID=2871759 RepID=UPI0024BEEA87|nr:alpha-protein kinase 3 isoform X1 [Seriola aureovittata]XP_056260572.1 alpha-protein kinase 3 isoform X1 [Seriola aureovittata]